MVIIETVSGIPLAMAVALLPFLSCLVEYLEGTKGCAPTIGAGSKSPAGVYLRYLSQIEDRACLHCLPTNSDSDHILPTPLSLGPSPGIICTSHHRQPPNPSPNLSSSQKVGYFSPWSHYINKATMSAHHVTSHFLPHHNTRNN